MEGATDVHTERKIPCLILEYKCSAEKGPPFWCHYIFNCMFPGLPERNEFIFNEVPAEECRYR